MTEVEQLAERQEQRGADAPTEGDPSKLKAVPHPTPAERAARGKVARAEVGRSTHGEWEPAPNRRDPVDLLEEQAQSRVPALVPIRYGRMLVSPFTFFRGAAYLMAADLAHLPRTGLQAQLCGDAHLSNVGAFAAPDRSLVFSVNDFDERCLGRSSGTSSGSSRASRSAGATGASTTAASGRRSPGPSRARTARR